jgi:hypothetical protein
LQALKEVLIHEMREMRKDNTLIGRMHGMQEEDLQQLHKKRQARVKNPKAIHMQGLLGKNSCKNGIQAGISLFFFFIPL